MALGFPNIVMPGFTQEWQDKLKAVPEAYMNCKIQITEPPSSEATYDVETNSYTTTPPAVLYEGIARITARRAALSVPIQGNTTSTQAVQFQIPIDDHTFDLRPRHRVRVIEAPLNFTLANYQYVVHELVDSGNPIEYTFWCTIDQEVDTSGD